MTRLLLIHAGPTPWDVENRVAGAHSLPLTDDALAAARSLVDAIATPLTALYLHRDNEACRQVGEMIGAKFSTRLRNREELRELRLGLWEGLTREELRRRFPTAFPQWEERPQTVTPPEGESIEQAVGRVTPALKKIVKRNRGGAVALVLRPMVMQIVRGLLQKEPTDAIAAHLQNVDMMETMELE
jgi:broad specificity phosphatase PhoE